MCHKSKIIGRRGTCRRPIRCCNETLKIYLLYFKAEAMVKFSKARCMEEMSTRKKSKIVL